jgi:long-chain-alcohol oxidase
LSFFLFPTKKVAELMVTRCIREAVLLGWVVLWMLGTRLGTLLLCGTLSLSGAAGELPSLHRFADMPMERREAALQRWNRTRWFFPLRIVFALVKILSHYVFYAMVSLCLLSVLGMVLVFLQLLGILL